MIDHRRPIWIFRLPFQSKASQPVPVRKGENIDNASAGDARQSPNPFQRLLHKNDPR